MAKITRKTAKVFGSSAPANAIAKFGSLAAGTPTRYDGTADPTNIQALAQYLTGWTAAISGGNSPALEDMNALCYLFAYQIAYALQTGVPEYDSATTYFIGSVVNDGVGGLFISLTDTNVGNALTSLTNWRSLNADAVTALVTGTSTPYAPAASSSSVSTDILWSTGAVDKVITLPTAVGIPGKVFLIKKTDTGTGKITVNTTSAQTIDGDTTLYLRRQYDLIHIVSDGVNWQVKDLLVSALFTSTLLNTATVAPSISVICIRRKGRMVDLIMPLDINPPTNKPNTSKPITAAALPTDFWPAGFPTSFAWNMPYPYNIAGTTPSGGASPQAFGCLQIFVSSGADDGKLQFAPAPGGSFSSGIQWNLWPFFCTYYLGTY